MSNDNKNRRLSDHIYQALRISLDQKDLEISELLTRALEQSMSRHVSEHKIEERRQFSDDFETALVDLQVLRKAGSIN